MSEWVKEWVCGLFENERESTHLQTHTHSLSFFLESSVVIVGAVLSANVVYVREREREKERERESERERERERECVCV